MDPASAALAILPICFGVLKGLGVVWEKLKILRRHRSEIYQILRKLRAHTIVFKGEVNQLVLSALGQEIGLPLTKDEGSIENKNDGWEARLRDFLGVDDYDAYLETARYASIQVSGLERKLAPFTAERSRVSRVRY
jgi:hypothetical protein